MRFGGSMPMKNKVEFDYIGVIHTPFTEIADMPIQPGGAKSVSGTLVIDPDFEEGLADLDGFSHIYVIYHLHKARPYHLTVTPFLDTSPHGLFATRAPNRPNPIGLSIVRLAAVNGNVLTIENVDMLDGTPVLDIKPYVSFFDSQEDIKVGWLTGKAGRAGTIRTDNRFDE